MNNDIEKERGKVRQTTRSIKKKKKNERNKKYIYMYMYQETCVTDEAYKCT